MAGNRKIFTLIFNAAFFIALEIAALNMLRSNGALQSTWVMKGSHAFYAAVWGKTEGIKNYFSLRKENDQKKKEEWLDSIESEIDSYRLSADTGNSVLDAVIEDKMLNIRKYNIEFTYVVNGSLLEFMHVTDICSIFGNGLDNAIEAEILEQDEEKRIIHLTVAAKRKMVCITMENYISHPETIASEHLESKKSDK